MKIKEMKTAQELLEGNSEHPKYEFNNFIKQEKFGERRLAKRKLKLLKLIDPAIQAATQSDEIVYYITSGLRVRNFEIFFIGWAAHYYNQTAFVFTSKKILLIHLKNKKERGTFIGCIEYSNIRNIKSSLLGSLAIKFTNGKSLVFTKIPKKDRVYLRDFLNSVIDTTAAKNKSAQTIRKMCPRCFTEILNIPRNCPGCDLEFKRPKKAAYLSLIMPGLGDLYLGSRMLGVFELLFMLYIWMSVVIVTLEEIKINGSIEGGIFLIIVIFLFFHPLDALKAYYVAKKGLMPHKTLRYPGE